MQPEVRRRLHGIMVLSCWVLPVFAAFVLGPAVRAQSAPASQPAATTQPAPAKQATPGKASPKSEVDIEAARREALRSIRQKQGGEPQNRVTEAQRDKLHPGRPVRPVPGAKLDSNQPLNRDGAPKPAHQPPAPIPNRPAPAAPQRPALSTPAKPAPTGPAGSVAGTTTAPAAVVDTKTVMTFTIAPPDPTARTYRFDYQTTNWNEVLADFSRMSGLPFINQPDPPITEQLTFRSPKTFTYKEALHQLNELLTSRPLNKYLIKRQENFLSIKRLPDWQREISSNEIFNSFEDMEKAELDDFDLVLVRFPAPTGWSPYEIIENFRTLFSDTYGTQVKGDDIELTGLVQEHRRFRELVNRLAAMGLPPDPDQRPKLTIQVKNKKATDIQNLLRQIYPVSVPVAMQNRGPGVDPNQETAKRIDIIADVPNNRLMVTAPARKLAEIEEMVQKLDGGTGPSIPETKVVKLEFADPTIVANQLKQIFGREQQSLMKDPTAYISPEQRAALDRDVFADSASNSIIIVGAHDAIARTEAEVKQWDRPDENQASEVIEVKNQDASNLAAMLTALFPPQPRPGQQPTRITPRNSKSLIVSANKSEMQRIRDLITKMDVEQDDKAKEHLVRLKAALPTVLASLLQQAAGSIATPRVMAPGRPQPMGGAVPGSGFRVLPDDLSGYLVVYCSDEEWERVEPLIRKLDDQAKSGEAKLTAVPLKNARAGDVVSMLRQMFPVSPPTPGKPPGIITQSFFADEYNNVVQIYASDEFSAKVLPLMTQLDVEATAPLTVIKLEHARADQIAPILQQSFGGGGGMAPSFAGQPQNMMNRGGQPVSTGGGSVKIIPEPITNSLLVTAPPQDLERIKRIVADMEAKASETEEERVVLQMKFRTAEEVAATLKSLSGAPSTPGGAPGAPAKPFAGTINIVAAGKQIIINGPRDQVAKSILLFEKLDVPYEQPVYRKYAVMDAEDDEKKLRTMLAMKPIDKGSGGGAPQPGGQAVPAAAQRLVAPEQIQIYADTYENTLLIGAKVEEDLNTVEKVLALITAKPYKYKGEPEKGDDLPFYIIKLKNKEAIDIAYDAEDLLNPDNKSNGIKLDTGPTKKDLLVRNCKPGQRAMVEQIVEMYDVAEKGRRPGRRILSVKLPPAQIAKLVANNYIGPNGEKAEIMGEADLGPVQVIDIHADESETAPVKSESIQPCCLPQCMIAPLIAIPPGQAASAPDDGPGEVRKSEISRGSPIAALIEATGKNVKLIPDPDTGKLILVGPEEELDAIEELIDELTEGDSPPVIRVFPLKNADVTTAAQLLEQVFNQGQVGLAARSRGRQPVTPQLPTPVVQPQQPGKPGVPGVPGQPQPGQPQGQQPVQAGPARIKVVPDARTKSLMVVAPPQDIPLIIDVLKKIDSRVPPSEKNIRIFRLQNLDATQVADNLREILGITASAGGRGQRAGVPGQPGQPGQAPEQMLQLQLQGQQGQPGQPQGQGTVVSAESVKLTADSQTNSIIAQGPTDTLDLIEKLIADLEKETNTSQFVMRRVPLKMARATELATIVKDIAQQGGGSGGGGGAPGQPGGGGGGSRRRGAGSVSVNADARTNSVILAGQAKDVERVEKIVGELDSKGATDAVQLIRVKVADAETLAKKLEEVFGARGGKGDQKLTIKGNKNNGTLYITNAEADLFEQIEKVAADMDTKPSGIQVRTFPLKHASAVDINTKLEAMMAKAAATGGLEGVKLDLVGVVPDARTNSLIVTGGPITFLLIDNVLKAVDQEPSEEFARSTKVYNLPSGVDANEIVRNIEDLFKGEAAAKSGVEPPALTANPDTNLVSIYANAIQHERIKTAVIDPITKAATGTSIKETRFIPLRSSKAEELAKSLTEAVKAKYSPNKRQIYPVTITADTASNNLIVTASSDLFADVESMVKALDQEGGRSVHTAIMPEMVPAKTVSENITKLYGEGPKGIKAEYHEPTNTVLVYATDAEYTKIKEQIIDVVSQQPAIGVLKIFKMPLKYAVADEVAKTLQEFFDKKSGAKGGSQNDMPFWMRGNQAPAKQLDNQVSIVAEPTSNMLLVYCTDQTKELIDSIISEIDTDAPGGVKPVMEMIALKYMDAQDMLAILTEYLKVAKRSKETGDRVVPWWADRVEKQEEKVVLAGDTRLKAVDAMNAIIVVGKPEAVADAVKKIKELDVEKSAEGDGPFVIRLNKGNASDIAGTLDRVFNDPKRADKSKAANYKPPTIVAEDATNSIIVRAKTSDFNLIKKMAEGLDQQIGDTGSAGVRILPVPTGRDVEGLARVIQTQMNDAENNKKMTQRDYKPSLVSIGADTRANALIVAGSKAKYDEAKSLVEQLVSMGPVGGIKRVFIPLKQQLTPAEAKKIIEQFQKGPESNKGPRSDIEWTRSRRNRGRAPVRTAVCACTLPGLMMQIAVTSAVAMPLPQTTQPANQPKTATIRPIQPTTQPASTIRAEDMIKAAASRGADLNQMTDAAKHAFQKKLSGAPISVAETGQDGIVVEGSEEDLEVIGAIINMLDAAIPAKKIEYVTLKNAQAKQLATTLAEVFSKLEKKGDRPAREEDKVNIIADARTNGIYIAATEEKMAQALDLIAKNEASAPDASNVKSFVFQNRRVAEAGEVLKKMIATYLKQKGVTDTSQIGIEIDSQTNTIFVTAGATDLQFVEKLVESLDAEVPPSEEGKRQPIGEADVMIVPLRVTQADALGTLLSDLLKKAATGDTPMKDFIRRFRLLDEKGNPLATVNLDRPIVIFGDKESNSLIIASTKENCLIMKQVAMAFDKEPARAEVVYKVFDLKFAESTDVADSLKKIIEESDKLLQRPGGKGDKSGLPEGEAGALVYKAVVSADPRTNQVVIVGRPDEVKILTDIITRMDVKGLDVMPFEIIQLTYASAGALEPALTELMDKRKEALPKGTGPNAGKNETVIIKGDPRSRSLIISANAARREELKGLIKKLDVPSLALIEDIRTITLKKGTATDIAEKLKKLWEDRQKQEAEGSKGFKLQIPSIVADERSNSLIVAAAKGDFDAIKSVVDKIEALELNPMANIYIVHVKFNSAKQLQAPMKSLFEKRAEMRNVEGKSRPEDKVAVEFDETTNSLLFAGSRENYDLFVQKVTELDQELGVQGVVEFFICDNVAAGRVKDTLSDLFTKEGGVFKPGATDSEISKKRDKVTITIDDRSNILIVSASPENMALVREIYKRMNSVTTPWDVAITKLITIENADAVKIAAQVKEYFDKLKEIRSESSGSEKSKNAFGITVFADERSNRIVIGGTKDGIDSAVELVKKLDVPPGTPGQTLEVYKLTEAPASKIGEMIKKVFEQRNKPRGGDTGTKVEGVPVTVEANQTTNSLLINAAREDHILIRDMITRLDRPSTVLEMARMFPLEHASAEKVKKVLEELYQAAEGGGGGGGGKSIVVIEDKRTNSVVVTAPPGELENIASLVQQLDTTEVKGQAEIGIYPCENEDAKKMAELLNAIMLGEGGATSSSSSGTGSRSSSSSSGSSTAASEDARKVQSMLMTFSTKDPQGREIFLKTIRENVQITFNERTNAIIAVAPSSSLRLIRQLVYKLDQIQKKAVLVRVFLLRNADATKMVDLLDKMFAKEEGTDSESATPPDREVTVEGGSTGGAGTPRAASQAGETAKGTFGRPRTTFVPDERTNAIIVAGWPEDIDVVGDVIDQLDSRPIQDRENIVYSLINATAEDVESALSAYFDAEASRLDSLGESVSPQRKMEQEVSIVAHPESNQLIISASPRYKSQVLNLIEQLDKPPPQVMIQVMIAEVSLDNRFEMGLEFALQQLRFSETAIPGGNGVLQSTHFDVVGGTDLGAAGSGLGGFSFTLTGEDFNFLVRALQADSRLEILQRPMIMCQDNQQATIKIGQSVPTPTGASTAFGQTNTAVQYQDVGVILKVEPHINPDGFVYMLVEPQVSSVSDSTIQIAPGSFAPIINQRLASTNVAVKDNETVVIGGLITTTENEAESKVPVLGDIPGLGILFRTTTRTKNKTELLIALTPKVVRTVERAREISTDARDESGIITDNMKQSPLFGKLQIQPETEDTAMALEKMPDEADREIGPGAQPEEEQPGEEAKPRYGPAAPVYGPMAPAARSDAGDRPSRETEPAVATGASP